MFKMKSDFDAREFLINDLLPQESLARTRELISFFWGIDKMRAHGKMRACCFCIRDRCVLGH